MAALSGTRRSRRKSVVKPRESSHSTRVHGKKIQRIRSIPQEDVAETKELVKEKGVVPQEQEPDWDDKGRESQPPKLMQMIPEPIDEIEEYRAYEKKRRKRIKKNVKKGWKELGLLEKRGLA